MYIYAWQVRFLLNTFRFDFSVNKEINTCHERKNFKHVKHSSSEKVFEKKTPLL